MKRILSIIAGTVGILVAVKSSDIFIYNPINRYGLVYITSAHTPSYEGMSNILINPILPVGIPVPFTKVTTNEIVVPLSISESNDIVALGILESDQRLRSQADSNVTGLTSPGLVVRALADSITDEINILRNEISIAKTNMGKFQTIATLPPRTLAQLKMAITNKVHSGSVD